MLRSRSVFLEVTNYQPSPNFEKKILGEPPQTIPLLRERSWGGIHSPKCFFVVSMTSMKLKNGWYVEFVSGENLLGKTHKIANICDTCILFSKYIKIDQL